MAKGCFKWQTYTTSPTYNSWRSMRNRCLYDNENSKHYKQKGIVICTEWIDNFDQFVQDMGERPEGTTLDRIDSNGDYEPSNCRWASHREQQNNKHFLTAIEYEGVTHTIGEWAYILDLDDTQLNKAYKRYSSYNATTFEELFYEGSLLSKRVAERKNKCKICDREDSVKWRKFGELCNTCYHRALRWAKKTESDIETFSEWEGITWKTSY